MSKNKFHLQAEKQKQKKLAKRASKGRERNDDGGKKMY